MTADKAAAALADAMQAAYYRGVFAEERNELVEALAKNVKLSTNALAAGRMAEVSNLRRIIRQIEGDVRRIDRMVEALGRRFPDDDEVRLRA